MNEIEIGLSSTPVIFSENNTKNYQKVILKGQFDFENQIFLYSLNEKSQPGFDVITPFETNNKKNILVNRGWINKELKDKTSINKTNQSSYQGVLKKITKPNIFKPENDIQNNIWFFIDIYEIEQLIGKNFSRYILLLEKSDISSPEPKKINLDLPNNHLKYALTWYSLALSILIYFLYFRKKQ